MPLDDTGLLDRAKPITPDGKVKADVDKVQLREDAQVPAFFEQAQIIMVQGIGIIERHTCACAGYGSLCVGDRARGREAQPLHVQNQLGLQRFGLVALEHQHQPSILWADQGQPAHARGTLQHRVVTPIVLHAAMWQTITEVPDGLLQARAGSADATLPKG